MSTGAQRAEAVQALYRVRAVEKPPEVDGTREIWHRAAKGAELLSIVDSGGRIERQDFILFHDVLRWTRVEGLRSGRLDDSTTEGVIFDEATSLARVGRAREALNVYTGKDAYLVHLRTMLDAHVQGVAFMFDNPVTSVLMPYKPAPKSKQKENNPFKRFLAALRRSRAI